MTKAFLFKVGIYILIALVIMIIGSTITHFTGWNTLFLQGWFCCILYNELSDWNLVL